MSPAALRGEGASARPEPVPRWSVVSVLGVGQVFAWGSSYYLPAVLAVPIERASGWPAPWIIGGLSVGLLISGLVSPHVGRTIERLGGRPVLAASAALLAVGLLGLALAPNVTAFVAAWAVVGLGMGCGLYDPAFALLGRAYGEEARSLITGVTLFGGFASTVCWPLSAFLVEHLGWRGTCLAYAGLHAAVLLPLYLIALPREVRRDPHARDAKAVLPAPVAPVVPEGVVFWLLAFALTLASVVMTVVSVQLLDILQARGLSLAGAVSLGALIGPAQVGARVIEFAVARRAHPVWVMLAAMTLVAGGLAMLLLGPALVAVVLILYGAGGGIRSIVRGTLPLALFGQDGYATVMGRLARPALVAQAASPALGALLLDRLGATASVLALVAAAVVNVVPVLMLCPLARKPAAAAG